jgi:hypothetical protein
MMIRKLAKVACALVAFGAAGASAAFADILDAEDWSNHIEEIQQINNTQQLRRTMNRSFDMMAGMAAGGGDGQSAADIAQQHAAWNATLSVSPAPPGSELQRFLKGLDSEAKAQVRAYLLREFAAYPAAAAQAAFNPANVADARVFALQTAFRAARPSEATSLAATMIVDLALTQQMAGIYTARGLTTQQKQETLDYYIIVRAVLLPAVPGTPEYQLGDAASRAKLTAFARAYVQHDAGVDPSTTSWDQLPCVGSTPVDCAAHMAMARSAMSGR